MNITAASVPSGSPKSIEPTSLASYVLSGVVPGAGPATTAATADPLAIVAAFDQVLSRTIAQGGETDAAPVDARDFGATVDATVPADALPTMVTAASANVAAVADPALPAIDPAASGAALAVRGIAPQTTGRATAAPEDEARATRRQEPDAVANDLAAQLALVSQWAGLAKPAVPADGATPPPTSDGTSGSVGSVGSSGSSVSSVDIKTKLDTIRAAASQRPTAAPDAPSGEDDAATRSVSLATALGRSARPVVESSTAIGAAIPTSGAAVAAAEFASAVASAAAAPAAVVSTAVGPGSAVSVDPASVGRASLGAASAVGRPRDEAVAGADRTTGDGFLARLEAAFGDASSSVAQPVAAAGAQSAVVAPAPTAAGPSVTLHAPVGTAAWSQEVGQATLRVATSDLQTASLRLNPEHLGPMEVQVRIADGVAHLAFNAAHVETRQAIEASRPTLDAMFADQGLSIGDCSVGDSGSSQRRFDADGANAGASRRDNGAGAANGTARGSADASAATVTTRLLRGLGTVDTFA